MKLRSRKIDADEASASAPKKTKMESFESIHPGMLVSYGEYGKCDGSECDGVPVETTQSRGRNLCKICAKKEFGDDFEENMDEFMGYEDSDAKFKCPAYNKEGSCKSKEVDIRKFYLGTCCEVASKVLFENTKAQEKQLSVVHYYYMDEHNFFWEMKRSFERSTNRVKKAGESIKKEEEALEIMKKKVEEAEKSLEEKKKDLEEKKKRSESDKKCVLECEIEKSALLKRFKQITYEYHSVAAKFPYDDEIEAKEKRKESQICKACGEDYNDTDRRKSLLPSCGHIACYKCFRDEVDGDEFYRELCPMSWRIQDCTKRFYLRDVVKIYE